MISIGQLYIMLAVILTAFSQILLKKSANKKYTSFLREYINFRVIFSYGLFFITMLLNTISLKTIGLKDIQVYMALSYLFVLIFSRIMLGEKITKRKLIGNIIIVFGIIVFNL
ncbi:EamA family transporter [Clostridium sp. SYSU_GA19001]|uniref:EamA family transporter n=1 Tax=Clostridium caldaquaticum TaxID=2940653 RepID=UPI0020770E24|nr:EamA family transporter [Clostridium caldaquaticum]MCM8710184.1 EamA family transporter [Clostridium caldaquaticum]